MCLFQANGGAEAGDDPQISPEFAPGVVRFAKKGSESRPTHP